MKVKARLFHCEPADVINNNRLAAVKDSPGLRACAGSLGKENTHLNSPNLVVLGTKTGPLLSPSTDETHKKSKRSCFS